jgi:hypothetical protein
MPVIRTYAEEKDMNIASPVIELHQKNVGGNERIAGTMFRYLLPQGFREFRLSEPGPAGAGHPHCCGLLAFAEAPLHGNALLAAQ